MACRHLVTEAAQGGPNPRYFLLGGRPTWSAFCCLLLLPFPTFLSRGPIRDTKARAVEGSETRRRQVGRGGFGAERGDGAGERVWPGGGERAVVRRQRAGRAPRVEQPRLLDRRRGPRLLPLGQACAPAPEGAGGEHLPFARPFLHLRRSGLLH